MVSKCLGFHLHTNHSLCSASITSRSPILSNFGLAPIGLFSTATTSKVKSTNNQNFHSFPRQRPILTPIAASGQSSFGTKFDDLEPDPTLTNDDLRPTIPSERNFRWWEMASLWIGLVVGVPTFYLAGSLVDLGMAWWQGIATVVAANIILLVPLVLTGHPGTKYGISFPVLARSSFGIRGAHVPTLLSALVGCGWYGIESWIGGEAIFLLLPDSIKQSSFSQLLPWLGTSPLAFACFIAFCAAQLAIVWRGMDGIRGLKKYATPILIVLTSILLIWAYVKAGGFGHLISLSSRLPPSKFWSLFFPSLTANISFWAILALNIPDHTRYAKSQADQIIGHAGLPIFMGAFTFVGLAVTSSTRVIFGRLISSPVQLLGQIGGFTTMILAIIGISLATLITNIAANVLPPANALVNLSPSNITFSRGALLTALLGIAFQPWRLLKSSKSFVYTWLVGYSALLGPIASIVLVDYYFVHGMNLSIKDLYSSSPKGAYYYTGGFNLAAMAALVIGILPAIPGFLKIVGVLPSVPDAFVVIYNNAWFFGFFSSGLLYWIFSTLKGKQKKAVIN